jgi:hypothetical protein
MGYITLKSNEQVWVQAARHDIRLQDLAAYLMSGYTHNAIEAMKMLEELGPLAIEFLPQLDTALLMSQHDPRYREEILAVMEKIKPEEKKEVKKESEVDVEIKTGELEADAQVFKKCNFCEKESLVLSDIQMDKLCPPGRFYCRFCLRHTYNNRDNRHILMLSMRSIFGYFFWQFYYGPPRPYMWLSEIKDYIKLHEEVGMRNPVFNYDPETYTWFIDFRRIGETKKKLPLKEVKRTVVEMLAVLNLHVHVKGLSMSEFYSKYDDAIEEFYHKRYRPEGKRLLSPTFKGCGNPEWGQLNQSNQLSSPVHAGNKISIEETRNFLPTLLDEHLWNKTSSV